MSFRIDLLSMTLVAASLLAGVAGAWQPAQGQLMTRWAKDVSPDRVLPEYPRPQMVRTEWANLNGLWEYAIRPQAEDKPAKWDGEILVPLRGRIGSKWREEAGAAG